MKEINKLYLKTDDLTNFKKIGHGTDGTVYNYQNDLLIKLYHKNVNQIINSSKNDEDIKIYEKGTKINTNYFSNDLTYYTYAKNEDVKLLPKEAIYKAIERRHEISLTSLPIGVVYLNNHFAGCILERQKGIQIHKLTGLPLNIKKKIYLNVLKAEAELLKNNVYHVDLSNSPYAQKTVILPDQTITTSGHSHILVNPFNLDCRLIDLEGKSTIYTENKNELFTYQSLRDFTILTLEFLLKLDWDELGNYPDELEDELLKKEIPENLRDKLINQEMNLEDFKELTRILKK